jgi:D-glycero-D-manno-heptose 1,7-bisphosphate phosphatase
MHPDELGGPGDRGQRTSRRGTSRRTDEPTVPVLYLDLDGTVRKGKDELGYFVNTADDVEVFPEVPDLLFEYKRRGWRIVGISNQGGIALGYMSMVDCGRAMAETDRQVGHAFDKIIWCPHHPDATDPEMAVCWCRKPRPGMIIETALALATTHNEIYPLHMGLFVGDMDSDRECAENAGLPFMEAHVWRTGHHLELIDA